MLAHLLHIFIKEFQHQKCYLILHRTINGIKQMETNVGKQKTQKEGMSSFQIVKQRCHTDVFHTLRAVLSPIFDIVDDSQKSVSIHSTLMAHICDGFLSKTQRNAKTTHDL
jgi:hypothetical protein